MLNNKVLGYKVQVHLSNNNVNKLIKLFEESNISVCSPYNNLDENAIMVYQTIKRTSAEMSKFLIEKSVKNLLHKNKIGLTVLDMVLIGKQTIFYEYLGIYCPNYLLEELKKMSLESNLLNENQNFTDFEQLKEFYFQTRFANGFANGKLAVTEKDLSKMGVKISDLRQPNNLKKVIEELCET